MAALKHFKGNYGKKTENIFEVIIFFNIKVFGFLIKQILLIYNWNYTDITLNNGNNFLGYFIIKFIVWLQYLYANKKVEAKKKSNPLFLLLYKNAWNTLRLSFYSIINYYE